MPILSTTEIDKRLEAVDGWRRDGHAIVRQFTFESFTDAVNFVARLVPRCEQADHHPDITINYRRVTLSNSTHSEGGVTEKDFAAAEAANAAFLASQ